MKELDDEYEISVDDMNPVTEPIDDWEVYTGEFMNRAGHMKDMNYLSQPTRSIFSMTDGLFILEEDLGDTCEYFYSEDINDLL